MSDSGELVVFLFYFCVAACCIMTCATYCCGVELPECVIESCWYKNGFCFFCDWGQNHTKEDRSKRYEEHKQQQMTTTTTTTYYQQPVMVQRPPVMVQQPPVLVQQAPQMVPVDLNGNGLVDGYAAQQRPPVLVQQPAMMV